MMGYEIQETPEDVEGGGFRFVVINDETQDVIASFSDRRFAEMFLNALWLLGEEVA